MGDGAYMMLGEEEEEVAVRCAILHTEEGKETSKLRFAGTQRGRGGKNTRRGERRKSGGKMPACNPPIARKWAPQLYPCTEPPTFARPTLTASCCLSACCCSAVAPTPQALP
eukprot:1155324-Pelagomonas_calceolata.AAC.2